MVRTRVGYTGGTTPEPTYHHLGDHSESVQVDFDPAVVSYRELLGVFWDLHRPTHPSGSRQYMSAVFYHDKTQQRLALTVRDELQMQIGATIYTQILPTEQFYSADNYHQKYYLCQDRELMAEFGCIYPQEQDFIDSTAAARLNSFAAGYSSQVRLLSEINQYGLPEAAREKLFAIVTNRIVVTGQGIRGNG